MRVLNVGVVGCGGIANNKHLPAMKRVGKINIVAFCDLIEERAAKAKEDFGTSDARIYTDYQELIKEDLDAVYVLTPNSSHAPIAIAAMKAGKHVMCEKPMAKTFAEAQEMVKTAKETGKILTIGDKKEVFNHPGSSAAARLTGCKNVIRAEKAGDYLVRLPDWECTISTAEKVPDTLTAVGIRAHDFLPVSDAGSGTVTVTLEQMTEFPFEWNVIFRTKGGSKIHWKISKNHLEGEAPPKIPAYLQVPKEKVLLLSDE